MAVACIALAVALGGTSYAAITLPANSVGAKQLKKNAVNSSKVKDFSLVRNDFKRGILLKGNQGDKGDKGDTGVPGTPATRLFTGVTGAGTLYKSSGAVSVTHPSAGTYEINFNQSIRNCVNLATATDSAGIMKTVGSERYAGPPEQVRVQHYIGSSLVDGGFDLAVFC